MKTKKPVVYVVTAVWSGTPEDEYDYLAEIFLNKTDAEKFCRSENDWRTKSDDYHERYYHFSFEAHQVK